MSAIYWLANRNLLARNIFLNQRKCLLRQIQTSQKKNENAVVAVPPSPPVTVEDFAKPNPKNWVHWGFDRKDETTDRNATHSSFFTGITLCLVWGTFFWCYLPDPMLRDWAQREGYLELRRREQAGLDLISPDYIDPANINLPSDEDLGDTEIII